MITQRTKSSKVCRKSLLNKLSKSRREREVQTFDRLTGRLSRVFTTCVLSDDKISLHSNLLVKALRLCLLNKGPSGLASLSKTLFEWSFQTYGESLFVRKPYYVRCDKRGRPFILIPLLNEFERTGDAKTFQFMLSILSVYRSFPGKGRLEPKVLKVIEDDNNKINDTLKASPSLRRDFFVAARTYYRKYDSSKGPSVLRNPSLYSTSAGASSRSEEIPTGEYPVFDPLTKTLVHKTERVRLNALLCAETEALALSRDKVTYEAWLHWCKMTDQLDLINFFNSCLANCTEQKVFPVNRIGFKPDKGTKNRPFAVVNYWIQLSLGGLHSWGYSILRKDDANHCFDHREAFLTCVRSIDGKTYQGCLDETAATDLFPITPISWSIGCRFGSKIGKAWESLMTSLTFYVPKYRPVRWGCGQPLGTKGSWPLYNIASEIVDIVPMIRKHGKIIPVELRVGDDTRFLSIYWTSVLRRWREEKFGVSFGDEKGIISKTAVEICKQYYILQGEVTPLSATLVDKAYGDFASFGMVVNRLHESSSIPYSSERFRLLASETSFATRRDGTRGIRNSFLLNRLAILELYCLPRELYVDVVRLISLTMIKRSLVEATNVSFTGVDKSFAVNVSKYVRQKAITSLRQKAADLLTDPCPELNWNSIRRNLPSPPKWFTVKVAQQRGLAQSVNFVTMSKEQRDNAVESLWNDIQSMSGYI
jgi:hypothetical protein